MPITIDSPSGSCPTVEYTNGGTQLYVFVRAHTTATYDRMYARLHLNTETQTVPTPGSSPNTTLYTQLPQVASSSTFEGAIPITITGHTCVTDPTSALGGTNNLKVTVLGYDSTTGYVSGEIQATEFIGYSQHMEFLVEAKRCPWFAFTASGVTVGPFDEDVHGDNAPIRVPIPDHTIGVDITPGTTSTDMWRSRPVAGGGIPSGPGGLSSMPVNTLPAAYMVPLYSADQIQPPTATLNLQTLVGIIQTGTSTNPQIFAIGASTVVRTYTAAETNLFFGCWDELNWVMTGGSVRVKLDWHVGEFAIVL